MNCNTCGKRLLSLDERGFMPGFQWIHVCDIQPAANDLKEEVMKSHPVPKVGDTVVLNDEGLEICFGKTLGLAHMKSLRMKITFVDTQSMTAPEKTYVVEVDNPEINCFLIYHSCFDIVESL